MKQQAIYVFTHDSIGLGEDGPTHQPVEQLSALRCIPNLLVIRPADANETAEAWKVAIKQRTGPTALVLTRQKLPLIDRAKSGAANGVARGAYVLADSASGPPRAVIMASGSEVDIALKARDLLAAERVGVRVVSMPCHELFAQQTGGVSRQRTAEERPPRGDRGGAPDVVVSVGRHRRRDRRASTTSARPLRTRNSTRSSGSLPARLAESVRTLIARA